MLCLSGFELYSRWVPLNTVKWVFLAAKIFPPYYPACDPITNKSTGEENKCRS